MNYILIFFNIIARWLPFVFIYMLMYIVWSYLVDFYDTYSKYINEYVNKKYDEYIKNNTFLSLFISSDNISISNLIFLLILRFKNLFDLINFHHCTDNTETPKITATTSDVKIDEVKVTDSPIEVSQSRIVDDKVKTYLNNKQYIELKDYLQLPDGVVEGYVNNESSYYNLLFEVAKVYKKNNAEDIKKAEQKLTKALEKLNEEKKKAEEKKEKFDTKKIKILSQIDDFLFTAGGGMIFDGHNSNNPHK